VEGALVAVVAGGGSGIGRATALKLAEQGFRTILVGRKKDNLDETVSLIRQAGGKAESFPGDIRDWDRMAELATLLEPEGLDLLINSAGGQFPKPSAELSKNGWKAVVETNLDGAFFLARNLHGALAKRRGAIVNIVANIWQKGAPLVAHSAAARAGVVNLTRTLAVEWAKEGIRVNAVSPGFIDTPALQSQYLEMLDTVPLGRIGTVEEVADAIIYMAQAPYVTGEVLTIDGGLQLV